MPGRFYFWPLMGMLWFLSVSTAQGQEKASLLLSAAAQDSHQMNMGDKKDGNGFQHVHALAMDAEGRILFWPRTQVFSAAAIVGVPGKRWRCRQHNPAST